MAGKVRIGVSGWRYTPWRGHFHPSGLAQWRELQHASRGTEPDDARRIGPARARERTARDVYCYFDNTDKRHAPVNARELMRMLDVSWTPEPA